MRFPVGVVAASVLTLAACSAPAVDQPSPSPVATAGPATSASAASAGPTYEPSSAAPVSSVAVTDRQGDSDDTDITKAIFTRTSDSLILDLDLVKTLPASSGVYVNVYSTDPDGEFFQAGLKFQDGEQIGFFVFNLDSSENTDVDGEVDRGRHMTISWPASELDQVGDTWRVGVSVADGDGTTQDEAPDEKAGKPSANLVEIVQPS